MPTGAMWTEIIRRKNFLLKIVTSSLSKEKVLTRFQILVKKILKLPKSLNVHFYGLNIINTYIYKLINRGKNVLKNFEIQFQDFETSPSASARKPGMISSVPGMTPCKPGIIPRMQGMIPLKRGIVLCLQGMILVKQGIVFSVPGMN